MISMYAIEHHAVDGVVRLETVVTPTRAEARQVRDRYRRQLKGQGTVHERWLRPASLRATVALHEGRVWAR